MLPKEYFLEAYYKGEFHLRCKEYLKAKHWYQIAAEHPELKEAATENLIYIELAYNNTLQTRIILNANESLNSFRLKYLYAVLEEKEYNFETSKKYLQECIKNPDTQYKALSKIAELYTQTGDNDIARKIYESLILSSPLKTEATLELVRLEILEGNYQTAYKLLETISRNNRNFQKGYLNLKDFLQYQLGILQKSSKNYYFRNLISNSDALIIEHISQHVEGRENKNVARFFSDIDLENLLKESRSKIKNMNPIYRKTNSAYCFKVDRPIGYIDGEVTSDIQVITRWGTNDIITMYPIKLSDEYDKEEFSEDKTLARKRKLGGKK